MRRYWAMTAGLLACFLSTQPAQACRTSVPIDLGDVKYADTVVVGRIVNYHIVRDEEFRRKMLANPKLPPDMRRFYADKTEGLIGDYAAFDVSVDEVLFGSSPQRISVTWDNSTFAESPTMPEGPFLIALRKSTSPLPPLRGPSATVFPDPDPNRMSVLEAPCSGPFLFPSNGDKARAIRKLLGTP